MCERGSLDVYIVRCKCYRIINEESRKMSIQYEIDSFHTQTHKVERDRRTKPNTREREREKKPHSKLIDDSKLNDKSEYLNWRSNIMKRQKNAQIEMVHRRNIETETGIVSMVRLIFAAALFVLLLACT